MFAEMIELLEQSFDLMVVLASGYVAYRIAYADKDSSHATVDVVFTSLVFAAVAKVGMAITIWLLATSDTPGPALLYGAALMGFFLSVALASLWRAEGEHRVFRALRHLGVSASDRYRNVLHTIIARQQRPGPTSLYVRCADGSRLLCERLADFEKLPFGPCLLGTDGSVALYVTHRRASADGEWEEDQSVAAAVPDWGCELTYLPPSQVAEIRINYPFSPSALAGVGQAVPTVSAG